MDVRQCRYNAGVDSRGLTLCEALLWPKYVGKGTGYGLRTYCDQRGHCTMGGEYRPRKGAGKAASKEPVQLTLF